MSHMKMEQHVKVLTSETSISQKRLLPVTKFDADDSIMGTFALAF